MEEKEMQKILNAVAKKKKFSKRIVSVVILLNIMFTLGVFVLSWYDRTIPDSLTIAFFSFTTTELLALAGIRIKKGGDNIGI